MRANGEYFSLNQYQFTNAIHGVDWIEEIGTPLGLHLELKRLNHIFNTSRQSALTLLQSDVDIDTEHALLPLSQFLTPHSLA